jgi:hypothetical protein
MPRSRWKAIMSSDLARKPPDGSGSSTMCGWSHSIMRAVISPLSLVNDAAPRRRWSPFTRSVPARRDACAGHRSV